MENSFAGLESGSPVTPSPASCLAMKPGVSLLADMASRSPRHGEAVFWWLGQHSFVLKAATRMFFFDPFLSSHPHRLIPPLLAPAEIQHADLILGTHDHIDHIDRPVWPILAHASPQCRFVVPELLCARLARDLALPPDRFVGLDDGATWEEGGIRVTGIAAAHEFLDRDPETGQYPYLGYILECGGLTFYHAGDTCIYEGMITKLRRWTIDVAFLPINGRDARRLSSGCIGNMTYQEAADLAGAIRPGLTVPAHYEMFAQNLGDVSAFASYMRVKYPSLNVQVCDHGTAYCVRGVRA